MEDQLISGFQIDVCKCENNELAVTASAKQSNVNCTVKLERLRINEYDY